jgi:hypothetical protein
MHIYNAHISVKNFFDGRILPQCCPSFILLGISGFKLNFHIFPNVPLFTLSELRNLIILVKYKTNLYNRKILFCCYFSNISWDFIKDIINYCHLVHLRIFSFIYINQIEERFSTQGFKHFWNDLNLLPTWFVTYSWLLFFSFSSKQTDTILISTILTSSV